MPQKRYIQLILPLKLEWEPYYSLDEGAEVAVGDRVKAEFAHREYIGVVSLTEANPASEGVAEDSIKNILGKEEDLPPISAREIDFWRLLSKYYLCTPGEVYKAAYPGLRTAVKSPRKKSVPADAQPSPLTLSEEESDAVSGIRSAFGKGKTVLLEGQDRTAIYIGLAMDCIASGKSVLMLVPEIALSKQLEEKVRKAYPELRTFHSQETAATKRLVEREVREGKAKLVLGTRSSLFLPFRDLGLVIVDDEHDSSYKQSSPAPRYNAREASIFLASVHGAKVLLGSSTPSLESLYNSETGLFAHVKLKSDFSIGKPLLINTSAEIRKNGMSGSFSLKLLAEIKDTLDAGENVLLVCRAKAALQECEDEIRAIHPDNPHITVTTPAAIKLLLPGEYALTAVLQADSLLGKDDFRADERALQLLQQLRNHSRLLVIQTRELRHPVFQALANGRNGLIFLPERRAFNYPPFTRIVAVDIRDDNEKRLWKFSRILADELKSVPARRIGDFTFILPRDKSLNSTKTAIYKIVENIERKYHYSSHITIDVDPA